MLKDAEQLEDFKQEVPPLDKNPLSQWSRLFNKIM